MKHDDGYAQAKRAPGKKDTKRWCKGKAGREHVIETVVDRRSQTRQPNCRETDYRWFSSDGWLCYHVQQCVNCGKISKHWLSRAECPSYTGVGKRPKPPDF